MNANPSLSCLEDIRPPLRKLPPRNVARRAAAMLAAASLLCVSTMCAAPYLKLDLKQQGDTIDLKWNIQGTKGPQAGASVFGWGFDPLRNYETSIFLGWYAAGHSKFLGTVADGWTDVPEKIDEDREFIFTSSVRYGGIFSPGVHPLTVIFYTSTRPKAFTPDGPADGPHDSIALRGWYRIKGVPDAASTGPLLSVAGVIGGMLAWRRRASPRVPS